MAEVVALGGMGTTISKLARSWRLRGSAESRCTAISSSDSASMPCACCSGVVLSGIGACERQAPPAPALEAGATRRWTQAGGGEAPTKDELLGGLAAHADVDVGQQLLPGDGVLVLVRQLAHHS